MRGGATIKPETLTAIESAQDAHANNSLAAEARTQFLMAYGELAKLAAPVTAESLRACSNECATPWKRWHWSVAKPYSEAERAVLRHHTWGSVALIVLLLVQIYWLIGATLISGIKRQDVHSTTQQPATVAQTSPTPAEAKTVIGVMNSSPIRTIAFDKLFER
jgi:hypothetical protein